ncbi:MAG: c-type cytochrome biogenesis protein CcsB [Nocardioidaceae bacterium]
MTTLQFADVSNKAIMFAGIVYALALLAHIVEWALGRQVPVPAAAAPATAPAERARETVPPGGASAVPAAPADGAASAADGGLDDAELRVEQFGRIGLSLTVLACLLHLVGLVSRGFASDPIRVPWGNMYEFTLAGTLGVSVTYLLLMRRFQLRWMGLVVTAFEVVILMLAGLFLYVPAAPLVPALHSYWLMIHVTAAIIASGAFAVGALASGLYLLKARAVSRASVRPGGYLDRLPELTVLDRVAYRVHAVGFPIWTFAALVAGPIWAEYAWGSYWNWDPKEVWAFITWVVYAAYLHARATAGWKGKAAAIIALIGFASLMFNFVGINFFFGNGSMHSYAGR